MDSVNSLSSKVTQQLSESRTGSAEPREAPRARAKTDSVAISEEALAEQAQATRDKE